MDGHLEVSDAISAGRLDLAADVNAVAAMFAAIEILLDASSRSPELQALAREFRERPGRRPPRGPVRGRGGATPRPAETVAAQGARASDPPRPAPGRRRRPPAPALTAFDHRPGRWDDALGRRRGGARWASRSRHTTTSMLTSIPVAEVTKVGAVGPVTVDGIPDTFHLDVQRLPKIQVGLGPGHPDRRTR